MRTTTSSTIKDFHIGLSTPRTPSKIEIGRVKGEPGTLVVKIAGQYHALNFQGFRGPKGWLKMMETPELFGKVIDAWSRGKLRIVEAPDRRDYLPPIVKPQAVFGAGVVYESSMRARRLEEIAQGGDITAAKDTGQHTQYDGVYDPKGGTPEVFFKGTADHVCLDQIAFRTDLPTPTAKLRSLPEPEIVIYLNQSREIVGYSLGSDTTACYIEATSTLRLPQAKTYADSMTLQRRMTVLNPEKHRLNEGGWPEIELSMNIYRGHECPAGGHTSSSKIVRPVGQIIETLARMSPRNAPGGFWEGGAVVSTGTGIIPENFTLAQGDKVVIKSPLLGVLIAKAEPIIFDGESPFTTAA